MPAQPLSLADVGRWLLSMGRAIDPSSAHLKYIEEGSHLPGCRRDQGVSDGR